MDRIEQVEREEKAKQGVRDLLRLVGEDVQREGLLETPARVVRAWQEMTAGYAQDPKDVLKLFKDGAEDYDEMIAVRNIPFYSACEHHMLPFFGTADIAYIPSEPPRARIVGLSKLARVLEVYARRLQVQERMTRQIADALEQNLMPRGVAVRVRARHMCMECRGVRSHGTVTDTRVVRGLFRDVSAVRAEFLSND